MVKIAFAFLLIFFAVSILRTPIASPSEIMTVNWSDISDKDISPSGKAALSFEAGLWKHAETEHFVYHFTDDKEAETIYVHAETYYKWIKDFFGVAKDEWSKKSHVFVFTNEENPGREIQGLCD